MENKKTSDIKNMLEIIYDGEIVEHENLIIAHDTEKNSYTVYVVNHEDIILSNIKGVGIVVQGDDTYYIVVTHIFNPFKEMEPLFKLMSGALTHLLGSYEFGLPNSYIHTDERNYEYKIFDKNFNELSSGIASGYNKNSVDKFNYTINGVKYSSSIKDGILVDIDVV